MAKRASFEEILAAIPNLQDTDREVLAGIAERAPEFKDSVLRKGDYSRLLDEVRDKVTYADSMEKWYQNEWVPDAYGQGKGGTKNELAAKQEAEAARVRAQQLEEQITKGADVNFDEVLKGVNQQIESRGFVDAKTMAEKEAAVNTSLNGYAHVATRGIQLAIRHFKAYGEELNVQDVIENANKKGLATLDASYEDYTKDKVEASRKAETDKKIADAREEGRISAIKNSGMSQNALPVDNGGPAMGHFEAKMLKQANSGGGVVPDDVELGKGIGSIAARAADMKDLEQRSV